MVVNKVIKALEEMGGTLEIKKLSNEDITALIDIESNRDNDIIPVINEGVKECFRRDHSIVLFKNRHFRLPSGPTLFLTTEDGTILGHDIFTEEEKEKYRNDERAYFLSDDFVIFKEDIKNKDFKPTKQYFILPPVPFPELNELDIITDVVSSSPSAESDMYLKRKYGVLEDPKIASIIVSFSVKDKN